MTTMTYTMKDPRPCIEDCGLAASSGDIYCDGCRSAVDDAADYDEAMSEREMSGYGLGY